MQRDLHALLNQQFRMCSGVFKHVVHDATDLCGRMLLPLTITQARDMRIR